MSDLIVNGNVKVISVPTLTTPAAPKISEMNTGAIDLAPFLTPDGLKITPSPTKVDTSSLASKYGTSAPGRVDYEMSLTFKKQRPGDTDAPFAGLVDGANAFIVVRDGVDEAALFAVGEKVNVYQVTYGTKYLLDRVPNEVQKWTIGINLVGSGVYEDRTTVA